MNKNKLAHSSSERRKTENKKFRGELDQVMNGLAETPRITKENISQLFALIREYYQGEGGRDSKKIFQMIREERADELCPALLEYVDDLLS